VQKLSMENSLRTALNDGGYYILAVVFFAIMGFLLFQTAKKRA
jgi:hypothetical protein